MFKKITLIALLGSSVAEGQIGKQILKQIEKANSPEVGIPQKNEPCDLCTIKDNLAELFTNCVRTICTERGHLSYMSTPNIPGDHFKKPAPDEKELEEIFKELGKIKPAVNTESERKKILDLLVSGKINTSTNFLNLSMQYLAMLNATKAITFNPLFRSYSLDEKKWNALALDGFSEKNKIALKEYAKVFIEQLWANQSSTRLESSEMYLSTKYPGLSKVDAVKRLVADLRDDFENFKKTDFAGIIMQIADSAEMFPTEIVSDIESGKDLTEMGLKELISAKNNFGFLYRAFKRENYIDAEKLIDYEGLKKQILNKDLVKIIASNLENQDEQSRKKLENDTASCLSIYRRNLLILPDESQLAKLNEEIEKVKKDIRSKWATKYSHETQRKINDYLLSVRFFPPVSKEDFKLGFKQKLNRELQKKKRQAKIVVKDRSTLSSFFVLTAINENNKSLAEKNDPGSGLCDNDKVDPLNDANYTLEGKIQVSYTSVQALEMGRGVLAHEMGHGLSQIFHSGKASGESSGKHKEMITCLESLHDKNGAQYSEEDYADFVAANIVNANKACLYPQFLSPTTSALENADEKDVHSSNFFRLMQMEAVQQNTLPDQCNQFLVEQRSPKDFLLCQKKYR